MACSARDSSCPPLELRRRRRLRGGLFPGGVAAHRPPSEVEEFGVDVPLEVEVDAPSVVTGVVVPSVVAPDLDVDTDVGRLSSQIPPIEGRSSIPFLDAMAQCSISAMPCGIHDEKNDSRLFN